VCTISFSMVTTSSIKSARDPDDLQKCATQVSYVVNRKTLEYLFHVNGPQHY